MLIKRKRPPDLLLNANEWRGRVITTRPKGEDVMGNLIHCIRYFKHRKYTAFKRILQVVSAENFKKISMPFVL